MDKEKPSGSILKKFVNLKVGGGKPKKKRSWTSSSSTCSDTFSTAILYRDEVTGAAKIHPFDPRQIDDDDVLNFFKYYKCYDIIHQNTKLVLLDTSMTLEKALHAMMEQGVRACPLWSSTKQCYVGMMTITDFMRILQKNYQGPDVPMEAFETATLSDWKDTIQSRKKFIHLSLDSGLIEACRILIENKIHRLPIVEPESGSIFSILNQKPLLKFLYDIPKVQTLSHLTSTIEEAGVGSYDNIAVARKDTKVIEALNRFLNERIAALPIVDEEGKLINIYSKFDVFNLESFADLEITLEEATKLRLYFDGVYCCRGSDSVLEVMTKLVRKNVNRLVIVDQEEKVKGIVTVSDMIDFLVLRNTIPSKECSPIRRNIRAKSRTLSESAINDIEIVKDVLEVVKDDSSMVADSIEIDVTVESKDSGSSLVNSNISKSEKLKTVSKEKCGPSNRSEQNKASKKDGDEDEEAVDSIGESVHSSHSGNTSRNSSSLSITPPPSWFSVDS